MSFRLPRAVSRALPASLPPAGLDGLDASFSRLVTVPESGASHPTSHVWHILDNADRLEALGVRPVGTILCVHGNPTWSYLWRRLLSSATDASTSGGEAWRVIAVDQLEMGYSERTGTARTLARRVADLGDFTDALGLERPVITLGHDWGGVISLGWATRHPKLRSGIMLLNTAVHQPDDAAVPAPLRLALRKPILGFATVTTGAFLDMTLSLAHPRLPADVKRGYRAPYRTAERRGGIGAFVADIPVKTNHESAGELDRIAEAVAEIDVPSLLLWGPRDPIFSGRYLDDLSDRMPHADVHRFEGAGHLIAEDADYASAVLHWLGDRRPDASSPRSPAKSELRPPTARVLWHYLDELSESDEIALIEMVPRSGATPRVISWRLLSKRIRQIAAGLVRIGVKPGDRVSLLVPPGADLTAVLYACVRIGAIVVVADAGLGPRGLTRAIRGARPRYLIGATTGLTAARAFRWPGRTISTTRLPAALSRALGVSHVLADVARLGSGEQLPPEPQPGDTAAILFTSGSTGPAKPVVYTHAQLSAVCDALAAQYTIGTDTGLVAGFAPFALLGPALGARSVTPDMDVTSPKTLTASAVAAAARALDADVVFLSPAALMNVVATADRLTADDHLALEKVRLFLSAGAPVSERLLSQAAAIMPNASAHTPYGMTEGLLMTDISLDGIREAQADAGAGHGGPRGVCVGLPAPSARVRISALDAEGEASREPSDAAGVTGEIVVNAPHLKDHYDRLWLTNREAARQTTSGERWHRTGDVGHLDSIGRLWIEGRVPHVITTAEGVVTPVGPEQRIETVDDVARCAVVGVGPAGTQQLVAVVELNEPARRVALAGAELAASVRAAAAVSIGAVPIGAVSIGAVPIAAVLVVPRLPTDIRHNSKIDRTRLARWASGILSGGRMGAP